MTYPSVDVWRFNSRPATWVAQEAYRIEEKHSKVKTIAFVSNIYRTLNVT